MISKDNFGRWQHRATINIKKAMMKKAEELLRDVEQDVADKLLEVHTANVVASYIPRSEGELAKVEYNKKKKAEEREKNKGKYGADRKRLSRKTLAYKHQHILEDALYVDIDKKSRYESRAVIKVHPYEYPEDHPRKDGPITASQVYEWLAEGTRGGGHYWFTNENGDRPPAYNYPTPKHEFEAHTQLQMKGYLHNLDIKKCKKRR